VCRSFFGTGCFYAINGLIDDVKGLFEKRRKVPITVINAIKKDPIVEPIAGSHRIGGIKAFLGTYTGNDKGMPSMHTEVKAK
jgi:hypothetical protein